MTTFMSLFGPGDTLADRMRAAALTTVVLDVAKSLHEDTRQALKETADAEQERTGTAFTARLDGVTALVTDPQPKPQVTDREAFAGWFAAAYPDDVERLDQVEVLDPLTAAEALRAVTVALADGEEGWDLLGADGDLRALVGSLRPVVELVLPANALDLAYDRGRLHVTADQVVDVVTGERVPGLTSVRARPTLQVKLEKRTRTEVARQVRGALGLPGGGA